jgi:hypothetical protein
MFSNSLAMSRQGGWRTRPYPDRTIRYSRFAIHDSLFALFLRSPLAARHLSPFAIRYSLFAVFFRSPLAARHSLLATRYSPSFSTRHSPFFSFAVFSQVCETAVGAAGKLSLGWRLACPAQCMNPHGHP